MISARFQLIKKIRFSENIPLREAMDKADAVIANPSLLPELFEFYTKYVQDNNEQVVETVFQNSPLKWSHCEAIVRALQDKGYITL
jgi:hypothetical protein